MPSESCNVVVEKGGADLARRRQLGNQCDVCWISSQETKDSHFGAFDWAVSTAEESS